MSKFDECISILGIDEDFENLNKEAKEEALASAWRKYSRKWHPDINKSPEAEEKFKQGNEANEWLKEYIKNDSNEENYEEFYEDLGGSSYYSNKEDQKEDKTYNNWENYTKDDDGQEIFILAMKILITILIIVIAAFLSFLVDKKDKKANSVPQKEQIQSSNTNTAHPFKVQPPSQDSQESQEIEKQPVAPPNDEHKLTSTSPYFDTYMKNVEQRIKENWHPPKQNDSKRVVLRFKVGKNGELLSVNITQTSDAYDLDQAAIAAVKLAAPFEPLPVEYAGNSVEIDFTFDYKILSQNNYR